MAYRGSVGCVDVLQRLSADLIDESQEKPVLLLQNLLRGPPATQHFNNPRLTQRNVSFNNGGNNSIMKHTYHVPPTFSDAAEPEPAMLLAPTPVPLKAQHYSPRGILKRQSSFVSTFPSSHDQGKPQQSIMTDSEMHQLLSLLNRLGLKNDAGAASTTQDHSTPPLFCAEASTSDMYSHEYSKETQERRTSRACLTKRKRSIKEYTCAQQRQDSAIQSQRAVMFKTVKNLLRGGGLGRRTACRNSCEITSNKNEGTISSSAKKKQKYVQPTIHTDAKNRVSTMKLGTTPMKVHEKHVAFPKLWDNDVIEREEADQGMPSPRGQLRLNSFITLETLDKIGTRAACPVHLINEDKPDYSRVSARVDSYNHVQSLKRGLQRPSTWLAGAALDEQVIYYVEH